jgi:glycosyltransferase involved in cell wall biosynthesis
MRIALVAQQPTDGDRIRLRELSRALTDAGHRVIADIGASGELDPVDGEAGDRELLARVPEFADRLATRWRRARPDVVHAVGWTSGLAALSATRGLDVPVVQSFGPLAATRPRPGLRPSAAGTQRIRLEAAIGRSAAAVLAASSAQAADLARLGVGRQTVSIVPCGVDTTAFTPRGPAVTPPLAARPAPAQSRPAPVQSRSVQSRSAQSQAIQPPSTGSGGPRRLVMVTGLAGHVGTAIRALPRLPGVELVIAGGPGKDVLGGDDDYLSLTALAKAEGVDDRVTFTGYVDRRALPALLRSADLLVSTSPDEPNGMAVLEAMACGLPVIACATGGVLPDIVIDGTTGLLLSPGRPAILADRIRWLFGHPMLLSGMRLAAADRAQSRYSWPRIATETLAVYEQVTGAAPAEAEAAA